MGVKCYMGLNDNGFFEEYKQLLSRKAESVRRGLSERSWCRVKHET